MNPIKIYCLGSDDDPATVEDIAAVQRWLERDGKDRWEDNPERYDRLQSPATKLYGRIPIQRGPWGMAGLDVYSIQCCFYEVEREGHGFLDVKIGSKNRPAQRCDLEDVQIQLAKALGLPTSSSVKEPTIVTHHNFDMKWTKLDSRGAWKLFIAPYDYPYVPTERELVDYAMGKDGKWVYNMDTKAGIVTTWRKYPTQFGVKQVAGVIL